jgi:hypothetical protein
MTTYSYRIKCMTCSLHYEVFSFYNDWTEKHKNSYCPECGNHSGRVTAEEASSLHSSVVAGKKLLWGPIEHSKQIFELIPGDYHLRQTPFGLGAPTTEEFPENGNRGETQ